MIVGAEPLPLLTVSLLVWPLQGSQSRQGLDGTEVHAGGEGERGAPPVPPQAPVRLIDDRFGVVAALAGCDRRRVGACIRRLSGCYFRAVR